VPEGSERARNRSAAAITVRIATATDMPKIQAVSRAVGQPSSDSGADAGYVRHLLASGSVLVGETAGRVVGRGFKG
jgi:hypothetical protein